MIDALVRAGRRARGVGRRTQQTVVGPVSIYLDRLAARRVLEAMIRRTHNFEATRWLDRPIWQFPLGAWVIQEFIGTTRPDVIVETGTYRGGSAYFYACLCDLLEHGEVISIDIAPRGTVPHPRITYVQRSSVDRGTVAYVADRLRLAGADSVLVVLDSDHSEDHVRRELEAYAPLVPVGSYLHVQDGCIDELPSLKADRPGPKRAIRAFLAAHPEFVRDTEIEYRYVLSFHPCGWLKRIA